MPHPALRVHIQNDAANPEPLHLDARRLADAASRRPALAGRLSISEDDGGALLPEAMADCEVLFAGAKLAPGEARAKAPRLRWIQSIAAGVESYIPTLPADMMLTNASGVHGEKGGEFVLASALMLTYAIPQFIDDKAAQRWAPHFGPTLRGRTVALLGVGSIGTGAARALRPFGCRLLGVTRSGTAGTELDACTGLDGLDGVLEQADIVVSTLPHTPATRNLVDRQRIGLLREGAGVVVVGRAQVFDYDALMDRLDAGTLAGAVLDVYPKEPVEPGDRLWTTPRLIMTPHCSIDDHGIYIDRCLDIFLDNLERYVAGQPLANRVDPSAGY